MYEQEAVLVDVLAAEVSCHIIMLGMNLRLRSLAPFGHGEQRSIRVDTATRTRRLGARQAAATRRD